MSELIDGQAPKSFPVKRMIGTALGVILLLVVPCRGSTSTTTDSSDWFGADTGWKSEFENFFAYKTRSTSNAQKPGESAHSETFVTDPWLIAGPSLNPDWPELALDPLGRWTFGIEGLLTGALSTSDGSTQLGESYRAAFNSSDPLSSVEILRIDISGLGATVVASPNLHLYLAGIEKSPSEVAAVLDSFLTPTGWFLDPSFDLKTFDFTNQSHLAQVFQLNAAMFLDDETTRSATIFTEAFTAASSAVPEPSTYALLTLGLIGIWLVRLQSPRKKP